MNSIQAAGLLIRLGHAGVAKPLAELYADLVAGHLDVSDLVLAYQVFHGLARTGVLADVMPHLALPRCGHPDVQAESTVPCRWPDPNVTYHAAIGQLNALPADRVASIYQQAWKQWSAVCGINPYRRDAPAAGEVINVSARAGSGAADNFDAAGTILAWSQLPLGATAATELGQVFNAAQPWTDDFFLAVACHEIGHAIGLSHSPGDCLMNPYYNPAVTAPTAADSAAAAALYGPAQTPLPAPPPEPPATPTPNAPSPAGVAASFVLDVPVAGKYLVTITPQ